MPFDKARRSGRISKQVPITLFGSDATGKVFTEETHTVVLSLHGAGIVSCPKLLAEQEMTWRSHESNREADIRVLGENGLRGELYTYDAAFQDDQLDFWQVHFPPPSSEEPACKPPALECSSCHAPITIENGDFEFDVCTIHGGLVRYSDKCAFATVWIFPATAACAAAESKSTGLAPSKPPHLIEPLGALVAVMERPLTPPSEANANVLESVADSMSSLHAERRLHGRAKITNWACIRSEAFGGDLVACFDMSRGGLSFRTRRAYLLHTLVRLAVPFSREFPEAPAIFVPAKIVSLARLPATEFFRCGVAFPPPKS